MTEAHRLRFVEENTLQKGAVRYPKAHREPVKAYDSDEASAFIKGLENEPMLKKPCLMTSLLLDLRRGEVVVLKWENVDFKKKCVSVNKSAYTEQYLSPYDESKRKAAELIADIVTSRERDVSG